MAWHRMSHTCCFGVCAFVCGIHRGAVCPTGRKLVGHGTGLRRPDLFTSSPRLSGRVCRAPGSFHPEIIDTSSEHYVLFGLISCIPSIIGAIFPSHPQSHDDFLERTFEAELMYLRPFPLPQTGPFGPKRVVRIPSLVSRRSWGLSHHSCTCSGCGVPPLPTPEPVKCPGCQENPLTPVIEPLTRLYMRYRRGRAVVALV